MMSEEVWEEILKNIEEWNEWAQMAKKEIINNEQEIELCPTNT